MIELMFPQTVSNILDYDGIKAAAKKYVEDVFVQITESFGNNLVLQSMDEAHLAEVARHVTGNPETTLEELLDYINTDNTYHEFEFVNELTTAFPEGVEYKAFEVTGWQFPDADFPPFSEPNRSRRYDGTPATAEDEIWDENASNGDGINNLMMSRFGVRVDVPGESITWYKTSGRRASWGNEETWMTTGGFGKPSTIHINVDEARTVIEKNGLSSVENWLGTVSNKLPINLYIEINDQLRTFDSDNDVAGLAGSTEGYPMAFPYEEEEGFCTNDPDWPGPEPPPLPVYGIPMGGMMSPTGHSTYYVQELPEQITVDNITLSGFMIPSSSLEEYFGNDQLEPESITINNDDVIIPLYDFDVPVTDQSKLYGAIRLNGTGTGNIPSLAMIACGGTVSDTESTEFALSQDIIWGVVE